MFLVGWNELANSDNHRVAVALVAWVSHPNQAAYRRRGAIRLKLIGTLQVNVPHPQRSGVASAHYSALMGTLHCDKTIKSQELNH